MNSFLNLKNLVDNNYVTDPDSRQPMLVLNILEKTKETHENILKRV